MPKIEELCLAHQYGLTDVAQILDFKSAESRFGWFDFFAHLGLDPLTCHGQMRFNNVREAFLYNAGHTDYQSLAAAATDLYNLSVSRPHDREKWDVREYFADLQARLGNDCGRVIKVFLGAHTRCVPPDAPKSLLPNSRLSTTTCCAVFSLAEEAKRSQTTNTSVDDYRAYIQAFN